jgi:hypothetical protein
MVYAVVAHVGMKGLLNVSESYHFILAKQQQQYEYVAVYVDDLKKNKNLEI